MNEYELMVFDEVEEWRRKMWRKSGMISRLSKKTQKRLNGFIPEKFHHFITESIKTMIKVTLFGSQVTTNRNQAMGLSLAEKDELVEKKISFYQKAALVEGAGTGAGGLLIGMTDFPLLLTIKMRFLFEAAAIYGFDRSEYEERLFILYIFQLAFSSDSTRRNTLYIIENWEEKKTQLADLDWREFQQEYRDYIDLAKLLQLVPWIGAVVGGYANHHLMKHLGNTAKNAYRLRILKTPPSTF
ncbi:MAG: EcsC family protein [Bacillota bacterium]|nr:EcsC family protein [Bacillota bacterium]